MYCIIVFVFFFFFFFLWKSPSLDSLLDHYHILHLQPTVFIFETVVEDLWSVSFLTIWRTGSSLLFFLNLADLYTRSRYHFFFRICSICFLATLLSIIFWVQTEDFIFLYGCKKGLFFSICVLQIWSDSLPKILVFDSYFISFTILFHIHFLPCGFC